MGDIASLIPDAFFQAIAFAVLAAAILWLLQRVERFQGWTRALTLPLIAPLGPASAPGVLLTGIAAITAPLAFDQAASPFQLTIDCLWIDSATPPSGKNPAMRTVTYTISGALERRLDDAFLVQVTARGVKPGSYEFGLSTGDAFTSVLAKRKCTAGSNPQPPDYRACDTTKKDDIASGWSLTPSRAGRHILLVRLPPTLEPSAILGRVYTCRVSDVAPVTYPERQALTSRSISQPGPVVFSSPNVKVDLTRGEVEFVVDVSKTGWGSFLELIGLTTWQIIGGAAGLGAILTALYTWWKRRTGATAPASDAPPFEHRVEVYAGGSNWPRRRAAMLKRAKALYRDTFTYDEVQGAEPLGVFRFKVEQDSRDFRQWIVSGGNLHRGG